MKLLNIFKKQKNRFVTKELISLSSLANVPTLDYFKDNNQVLLLINLRKKDYLEILIKEKVLTSSELKAQELRNKLKMIHTLIEQNTLGDELFEKVIFNEEDKVKALIKLRKFAIYNEQIKDLEEEIVSRIIALKEILKKTFLNKQKRISIINEVNNLTNIFVILMNQKETLRLCLNTYGLKCFDITKEKNQEKEGKLIKMRKEELNAYQKQAFGKIVYELNDLNDMAQAEVALEDYVYNAKENGKKLREELNNINSIEEIEKLEKKYYLYYEFGKNIVANEDLKNLYRLKFKYLTTWRYEYKYNVPILIETFITDKTSKLELETYKERVFELINDITTNKHSFLSIERMFGENYLKVIRLLKKELQTNGAYNTLEILNNKYKLNLLIAFSYPVDTTVIKNIYKLIYVKKSDYPEINFYEPEFTWNEELSLETINELKLMQNQTKNLGLYLFLKKYSHEYRSEAYRYTLPEGLKIIDNLDNMSNDVRNFINGLQKNMKGKDVMMPSTLEKLKGNIFESTPIQTLILNDELEYCDFDFLESSFIQGITIPTESDFLNIFYNYLPFENGKRLRTIEFKNFDQSVFYNNFDELYCLLDPFITATYLFPFLINRVKTRLYELTIDRIYFTFSTGETIVIKRKDWQVKYASVAVDKSVLVKKINKKLTCGVNLNNNQKRELTKH